MTNLEFEPIRIRIMQEAYDLADRGDSEGYNSVKVMCSEIQQMLPSQREWVGLTDEEIETIRTKGIIWTAHQISRAVEAKLKEKNGGEE